MKLPKELTTVTPLSKYLAMILFISLPFIGFYIGIRYEESIVSVNDVNSQEVSVVPTPTEYSPSPIVSSIPVTQRDINKLDKGNLYLALNNNFIKNPNNDGRGTTILGGLPVDIVIPLPSNATVQIVDASNIMKIKSKVVINSDIYLVEVDGNSNGPCSNGTYGTTCTGNDSELRSGNVFIETLRIWRSNNEVFMINPITIFIGEHALGAGFLKITKTSPNTIFSDAEVSMWRDLLGKMLALPIQ